MATSAASLTNMWASHRQLLAHVHSKRGEPLALSFVPATIQHGYVTAPSILELQQLLEQARSHAMFLQPPNWAHQHRTCHPFVVKDLMSRRLTYLKWPVNNMQERQLRSLQPLQQPGACCLKAEQLVKPDRNDSCGFLENPLPWLLPVINPCPPLTWLEQ